jgi:hypothetical protein
MDARAMALRVSFKTDQDRNNGIYIKRVRVRQAGGYCPIVKHKTSKATAFKRAFIEKHVVAEN